ncbi:MAG TPA: HTTM domain-containing protein [Pirellulaceae bacterium]|nr:HTTM domain-containing protein [Pirellulaceae bacterium]
MFYATEKKTSFAPHIVSRNRVREKTTELLGVDLRSLAAFRIGAAGVLLLDLWYRGQEITAYFTDAGVLPRSARIDILEAGDRFGFRHTWSLHLLSGEYWAQLGLMLLAALFAVWLLIGYRTRLAAVASWILLMSLDGRNPVILNSGDVLLRSMLLWSLFLPLGARFSFDASRIDEKHQLPTRVVSMATVALLLQLCLMYWFSTVFKMQALDDMPSPWMGDYSAVYYALNCDAFVTRFGLWLRQFPTVMQFLTGLSLWLELVGPVLAFSPWFTKWFRGGAVVAFIAFHVGLGLCLTIGLFPVICIVSWLVFLPSEFWEVTTRRAGHVGPLIKYAAKQTCERYGASRRFFTGLATRAKPVASAIPLRASTSGLTSTARRLFAKPETPSFRRRWYIETCLAVLLVYVVIWNVRETDFKYWEPRLMSRDWNAPARILGLDQNWSMFAPLPRTEDGWLVMEGTLHDGSTVNLWEFDEPLPWSKPPLVSATYHTQRWRKYLDNLTTESYAAHRMYFCEWLARRWNEERAEGDKMREIHRVELSHRIELTPPPGQPIPDPETRVLWTWYFE